MTVSLDVNPRSDVAVLHGVDTEAALAHLCRAVVTGSAFDVYRALVVDLDGATGISDDVATELAQAGAARRERGQWFDVADTDDDVDGAVARAKQWLRLVDDERPNPLIALASLPVRLGIAPLRWVLRRTVVRT